MGKFFLAVLFLIALATVSKTISKSNGNLYILHTKRGDIQCNYHNSRDVGDGWLDYIDAATKADGCIMYSQVDSITILSENWMTCGPHNEKMRYIDRQPKQ